MAVLSRPEVQADESFIAAHFIISGGHTVEPGDISQSSPTKAFTHFLLLIRINYQSAGLQVNEADFTSLAVPLSRKQILIMKGSDRNTVRGNSNAAFETTMGVGILQLNFPTSDFKAFQVSDTKSKQNDQNDA